MFSVKNKENDVKTQDDRANTFLAGEPSQEKVRRSVLKEFDPFAPESPLPPKIPRQPVDEDDVFEDAETSLSSYFRPINKSVSSDVRESLLIPELKEYHPRYLKSFNDSADLSYVECLENLPQLNNSKNSSLCSEDDIEFNYKCKINAVVSVNGQQNQSPNVVRPNPPNMDTDLRQFQATQGLAANNSIGEIRTTLEASKELPNVLETSDVNLNISETDLGQLTTTQVQVVLETTNETRNEVLEASNVRLETNETDLGQVMMAERHEIIETTNELPSDILDSSNANLENSKKYLGQSKTEYGHKNIETTIELPNNVLKATSNVILKTNVTYLEQPKIADNQENLATTNEIPNDVVKGPNLNLKLDEGDLRQPKTTHGHKDVETTNKIPSDVMDTSSINLKTSETDLEHPKTAHSHEHIETVNEIPSDVVEDSNINLKINKTDLGQPNAPPYGQEHIETTNELPSDVVEVSSINLGINETGLGELQIPYDHKQVGTNNEMANDVELLNVSLKTNETVLKQLGCKAVETTHAIRDDVLRGSGGRQNDSPSKNSRSVCELTPDSSERLEDYVALKTEKLESKSTFSDIITEEDGHQNKTFDAQEGSGEHQIVFVDIQVDRTFEGAVDFLGCSESFSKDPLQINCNDDKDSCIEVYSEQVRKTINASSISDNGKEKCDVSDRRQCESSLSVDSEVINCLGRKEMLELNETNYLLEHHGTKSVTNNIEVATFGQANDAHESFQASADGTVSKSIQLSLRNEDLSLNHPDQSNLETSQDVTVTTKTSVFEQTCKNTEETDLGRPMNVSFVIADANLQLRDLARCVDGAEENDVENNANSVATAERTFKENTDEKLKHSDDIKSNSATVNTSFVIDDANGNIILAEEPVQPSTEQSKIELPPEIHGQATNKMDMKSKLSFVIAGTTEEDAVESEKALEALAQSLNQTIDAEESSIVEIDSTGSSSDNLNITVEVGDKKDSGHSQEALAVDADGEQIGAEENQTEVNKISMELNKHVSGDTKTIIVKLENISNETVCGIEEAETSIVPPKVNKKIECRPNIRALRNKTLVITNPLVLKVETANDDAPFIQANEKLLEGYKKKSEQLKNDVDKLQKELNQIQENNMKKDQHILSHALSKEADRNSTSKYKKVIQEYQKHIKYQCEELCLLKNQMQELAKHFDTLEMAFSDVFEKYEKAKVAIEAYRRNEEVLFESIQNTEYLLNQLSDKCKALDDQCKEDVKKAQEQVNQENEVYKQKLAKLQAIVKRLNIKASSLEISLKQKSEECQALAALCDDITGTRPT